MMLEGTYKRTRKKTTSNNVAVSTTDVNFLKKMDILLFPVTI